MATANTSKLRPLGRSGISIPPLVLGGNVFGWTADEKASFAVLDAFVAGGGTCIDTADAYSRWAPGHKGGESEAVIGKWLKRRGRHDDLVIATKVGSDMGQGHKDLSAKWIAQAVEDSLQRLGTDRIDLYQSHWDDPEVSQEETGEALAKLVKAGKVRALGCSNFDAKRLKSALAISQQKGWPRYETLQPHYNLLERPQFEGELAATCIANGVGVISYFGLARGFLTGKYRSEKDLGQSQRGEGVKQYLTPRGFGVLRALEEIAAAKKATLAQVSLAWIMAQPGITAPIASATNVKQVEELLGALALTVSADDLKKLNRASAQ
jgi:aryl-alcohol dehydrogenase-like predicted oxidoreductase